MNKTGSAVRGLEESCADRWEKSTITRDAKQGCYFEASPFAMITSIVSWASVCRFGKRANAELLFGEKLLKQIECARIARLPQPEQCLLPDLRIPIRLRDRN